MLLNQAKYITWFIWKGNFNEYRLFWLLVLLGNRFVNLNRHIIRDLSGENFVAQYFSLIY